MEHTNIIKDFFGATAFLLRYRRNEMTLKAENDILDLICEIHGCPEDAAGISEQINLARKIELCTDEKLLQTMTPDVFNIAVALKLEALHTRQIERNKHYNPVIFAQELKEGADLGDTDACKMLAHLYWLGSVLPQNKSVALKIWSSLAANGDWASISALIYAYDRIGDSVQADKWRKINGILMKEYEAFSPVALASEHPECSEEEIQFANLILYIRQKNVGKSTTTINRPMLHYVLKSNENFECKMERLASDEQSNYCLVMKMEDRFSGRKFGF